MRRILREAGITLLQVVVGMAAFSAVYILLDYLVYHHVDLGF